jgi:hypothetical protein
MEIEVPERVAREVKGRGWVPEEIRRRIQNGREGE